MAQEKVEALVSDDRPNEGQSITYEIRVTYGNIQSVALTGLDDFEILVGPSTSRSVQIIGGTVSSVSSYQWTLLPKKAGRLVIPALSVRVDGKTRRTNPVTVNVQSVATARGPGKTSKQSNLFLEATIDIEHPYRGQQVTVTWTLYTQVSISGWQIVTIPGLTGFWTENLFTPKTLDLKPIDRDGQRYYSAVVRRMALFPTRSGELEIDPLAMEIGIRSSRRS
ncbi:MAG: BatD family protein, partial [Candidatus Marinimicrobia bacterium]|nr:BatD family protein [Candidatus Neomarinimicrobiota bacterium]